MLTIPIVLHELSLIIDYLNVWNLPLRSITIVLGAFGLVCFMCSLLKVESDQTSSHVLESPKLNDDFGKDIHRRIRKRLKGYRFWSTTLMCIFVFLGVVSVISALIAATYTDALSQSIWLKVFILVSAVSSALITAFNLQGKSSDVWRAFRHLEQAILEYDLSSHPDHYKPDIDKLLLAYKEAENMVGFFKFINQTLVKQSRN